MDCPRCGKNIGGYVELGSTAYQRVQSGRCPHCGGGMPSGHSVGFVKQKTYSSPRKVSDKEYDENVAKYGSYKTWCFIFSLLGGLSLFVLISNTVGGIIAGILYFALLFGFSFLWYNTMTVLSRIDYHSGQSYYTEEDLKTSAYTIFVGIVSIILTIFALIVLVQEYGILRVLEGILGLLLPWIIIFAIAFVMVIISGIREKRKK